MSRPSVVLALSLLLAVGLVGLAWSRGAQADGSPGHRIVFLFVTGSGPQAKAWYDGAAPQGVPVQAALDKFAGEGFKYAAISSSGLSNMVNVGSATPLPMAGDTNLRADYVILLER